MGRPGPRWVATPPECSPRSRGRSTLRTPMVRVSTGTDGGPRSRPPGCDHRDVRARSGHRQTSCPNGSGPSTGPPDHVRLRRSTGGPGEAVGPIQAARRPDRTASRGRSRSRGGDARPPSRACRPPRHRPRDRRAARRLARPARALHDDRRRDERGLRRRRDRPPARPRRPPRGRRVGRA